jgi:hypothetical protein
MPSRLLALALLPALAVPAGAAAPPRPRLPEAAEMLAAILWGGPVGPGRGWYHPSRSAYGWGWLAARFDADGDGAVTRREFRGPPELFDRLDRDGDGRLTAADFDWSPHSPAARRDRLVEALFRRADRNLNGRVSAKEWQALFKEAAGGKGGLTREDLRGLLYPPRPARANRPAAGGMPSRWTLLNGLLSGEIGSPFEGPAVGEEAPAFRLRTHEGRRAVSLAEFRGKRPVVLIFGSFT